MEPAAPVPFAHVPPDQRLHWALDWFAANSHALGYSAARSADGDTPNPAAVAQKDAARAALETLIAILIEDARLGRPPLPVQPLT